MCANMTDAEQIERMTRAMVLRELAENVATYSKELEKENLPPGRVGYLLAQFQSTLYEMLSFRVSQSRAGGETEDAGADKGATPKN